jgi:K+ transporter
MGRKEVNIFGVSFLDLLSGALAAVIILFVVIPKMTSEDREASQVMEELGIEAADLAEMIAQLENSVDSSVYNQLQQQMKEVESALARTQSSVNTLQEKLAAEKNLNEQLKDKVQQLTTQVADQQREIQAARDQVAPEKPGDVMFGVNAELAIVFQWKENADVDISLYSHREGGWCNYNQPNTPFAQLLKDVQDPTVASYEVIYQSKVIPGKYDLYAGIYDASEGLRHIRATAYIVMFPSTSREKKIDLGNIYLEFKGANMSNLSDGKLIRSFTVTADNIY